MEEGRVPFGVPAPGFVGGVRAFPEHAEPAALVLQQPPDQILTFRRTVDERDICAKDQRVRMNVKGHDRRVQPQ